MMILRWCVASGLIVVVLLVNSYAVPRNNGSIPVVTIEMTQTGSAGIDYGS